MESGDVDQLKRATDSQNFGPGEVSLISDGQIEPLALIIINSA